MLPERLDDPQGVKEKMQALRIELLHALHRRGGRVPLQELGQEPRVQQRKTGLNQAKKLIDFIRLFDHNFVVTATESQMIVEIGSLDVSDVSMIDRSIQRNQQNTPTKGGFSFQTQALCDSIAEQRNILGFLGRQTTGKGKCTGSSFGSRGFDVRGFAPRGFEPARGFDTPRSLEPPRNYDFLRR